MRAGLRRAGPTRVGPARRFHVDAIRARKLLLACNRYRQSPAATNAAQ